MLKERKSLCQLIEVTDKQLHEMNYSQAVIYSYRRCWRELIEYAEERNVTYYSVELGEKYLLEKRGIDIYADKKTLNLPIWKINPFMRAINVLTDMQNIGVIRKIYHVDRIKLPENYSNIAEQFCSKCRQRYNSERTIIAKDFAVKRFLNHLIQTNILSIDSITLKDITSVVMDKTGTITKGNFKVQDVIPLGNATRHEILSLAASCEESSTHPIGKSIMEAAKDENVTYKTPENAKEIAGHGSVITIDNSEILAGNKKLMAQYHVTGDYPETTSYGTEVFLAKDGVLIGAIVIADTLKDDAKSAIASLKAQNLHTVMLTGDSETTANAIAKETGIDEVYSRLLPDEKLAKLQEQRSKHGAVMFVGDGINDAPVLAGADCGAAMGSGADAAIEAADVVFMTSNVEAIPQAISIGKKACKIAWQNVVFALAIKALVMILGLLGFANMWMAVFADSGVAMLCVINSIRAMKL